VASLFDKLEGEAFRKGLKARSKEANANGLHRMFQSLVRSVQVKC